MEILITGCSGFIASHITAALLAEGHSVTYCVRNVAYSKTIFPKAKVIACNLIHDTKANIWIDRLQNIDIVINCVGNFYHPSRRVIWAIHHDTSKALFDACSVVDIKKIIQISTLGIKKSDVDYANSKNAADKYLQTLPIPSFILRPSIVYGKVSYGGSSILRELAAIPWFTSLLGKDTQELQPIHILDLAKSIVKLISIPIETSHTLKTFGPKNINLEEIMALELDKFS